MNGKLGSSISKSYRVSLRTLQKWKTQSNEDLVGWWQSNVSYNHGNVDSVRSILIIGNFHYSAICSLYVAVRGVSLLSLFLLSSDWQKLLV